MEHIDSSAAIDGFAHELFRFNDYSGTGYYTKKRVLKCRIEDPTELYRELCNTDGFLIENRQPGRPATWSIGFKPYASLEFDGHYYKTWTARHDSSDSYKESDKKNVLTPINIFMSEICPDNANKSKLSVFGYVSFEMAYLLDNFKTVQVENKPSPFPMLILNAYQNIVEYDIQEESLVIHSIVDADLLDSDAERIMMAEQELDNMEGIIRKYLSSSDVANGTGNTDKQSQAESVKNLTAINKTKIKQPVNDMAGSYDYSTLSDSMTFNYSKDEFIDGVLKAKEHIAAGDIFQVVLSLSMSKKTDVDSFLCYRVMRELNPSPYMYYMDFGKYKIIGTSPEMLVQREDDTLYLNPIAGTRRRGKNMDEDESLMVELINCEKERAEHVMLVDLGRNDLGKVSKIDSVKVDEFMKIEKYSHVMHMVSRLSSKIREDKSAIDVFASTFPAGTVSGAPKNRALEIIRDIEPTQRGPYAGTIARFQFDGGFDSCITIRSICFDDQNAYIQSGAGVVADSNPEHEYNECMNKARIAMLALAVTQQLEEE